MVGLGQPRRNPFRAFKHDIMEQPCARQYTAMIIEFFGDITCDRAFVRQPLTEPGPIIFVWALHVAERRPFDWFCYAICYSSENW